jgi:hypothetical protein
MTVFYNFFLLYPTSSSSSTRSAGQESAGPNTGTTDLDEIVAEIGKRVVG